MVPYSPLKKQRPKVDLDEETNKVWKLLMLDINSHGVDGTDEEKEKWWEEERNVFRGRADSFIARMHLVQGIHFKEYKHYSHKSDNIVFQLYFILDTKGGSPIYQ